MIREQIPQNNIDCIDQKIDRRVLSQKEEDLKDLFKSSNNPLSILMGEMDTQELRKIVDNSLIDKVKSGGGQTVYCNIFGYNGGGQTVYCNIFGYRKIYVK